VLELVEAPIGPTALPFEVDELGEAEVVEPPMGPTALVLDPAVIVTDVSVVNVWYSVSVVPAAQSAHDASSVSVGKAPTAS
jgi:hypothetical protein